ncbi:MAG: glycosyltransferase family 4 protein [candidate division Zixibacteria bacterium]|nr:glycosyltransferase family 4 protein [candidate division Zixibacteria bacterium]
MLNRITLRNSANHKGSVLEGKKIAIVHDWLITYGGAERVLEQLLKVFPQADLFALYDFTPENQREYFLNKKVTTSFLQKFPFARKKYRSYLPFMPLAVEQLDLSQYDIVISSSHAVAHGVLTNSEQLHLSYINNTMIYAWDMYHHYLNSAGLGKGISGLLAKVIMHYIRNWDSSTANRVNKYISNSAYMSRRIDKLYGKNSDIIYPPVETDKFDLHTIKEDYYVAVSRFVPFKRIDLIVDAFTKMPDKKLVIIGDGPDMKKLKAAAGKNIRFKGFQKQEIVNAYVKRAKGFLFTSVEPFGIAVVEALACGTPVIAYGEGAAPEIITDGEHGVLFDKQTPEGLIEAVNRFENINYSFDPEKLKENAQRFSSKRFRNQFKNFVENSYREFINSKTSHHRQTVKKTQNDRAKWETVSL